MRQPRTDREPGPPPAFQQSTHKNQSTSFLSHLPDFGKCKTLSISCQNTVNFIGLSGSGRARGALVPCLVPFLPHLLRPNLLRPIAFRRKKQMKLDTMPVLHRALILPQYTLNVPYFVKDVKGGDFPAVGQIFCSSGNIPPFLNFDAVLFCVGHNRFYKITVHALCISAAVSSVFLILFVVTAIGEKRLFTQAR